MREVTLFDIMSGLAGPAYGLATGPGLIMLPIISGSGVARGPARSGRAPGFGVWKTNRTEVVRAHMAFAMNDAVQSARQP